MASLDTNLILRLVLQDIPEEVQRIVNLLEASHSGSLVVEDVVFCEAVWILSRPPYILSRADIGRALLKITGLPQVKCNRPLLFKALPLYVKHPKLSFVDVCLAAYAELNRATPLLTLDKALARQLPNASLLT